MELRAEETESGIESGSVRRSDLRILGWVCLATVVFLGALEATRPYTFLWDDNSSYFLPFYVHNVETLLAEGELPHVNFHQYLGHSYLANGQPGVLYPPIYGATLAARGLFGDPRGTIDLLAIVHWVFGAVGMFVLLRSWGLLRTACAVGALLWVTWPFSVQVARSWVWMSYLVAFLPWNLWFVERLCRQPTPRRAIAAGVFKAFMILPGHAQSVVLVALFEAIYLAARWIWARWESSESWHRQAAAWLGCQATSGLLAAPLLIPMLHAKQISATRAGRLVLEEVLSLSLEPGTFLGAQFFRWEDRAIHEASGGIFYVGVPLLLTLLALARRPDRQRFLAAGGVALLALVASTRAYGLTYSLPLLGSFRWPFKSFVYFLFFLTPPLAGAFDRIWRDERSGLRALGWGAAGLGVTMNVVLAFSPAAEGVFGPERLDQSVAELRRETDERLGSTPGRVASLWMDYSQPRIHRFLVSDYATLAKAYQFAGYEPLIAKENLALAAGLEYDSIFRFALDQNSLAYLESWAVRYLVAPDEEHFLEIFGRFPQLEIRSRREGMLVIENHNAAPFAELIEPTGRTTALEVTWGASSLRVGLSGREGIVRVRVAPLPWLEVSLDGREAAPPALDEHRQLLIPVPTGVETLEVRYVDVPFRAGCGVAGGFLLSLLAVTFFRNRRRKSRPGP